MRIGDVAVIAGEPVELPNDRVVSRSMDNRLGCFVALEAARLVAEAGGAPGDVVAVAVAQEEITFGGARTTAYSLRPDIAIVVDVTFATDAPGIEEKELGRHKFGSGPVIDARLDARPGRSSSCCTRRARPRASRSRSPRPRARHGHRRGRVPHLARAASRSASSRSRCATCTRRSRWCSSTTSRTRRKLIAAFARRLEPGIDFQR